MAVFRKRWQPERRVALPLSRVTQSAMLQVHAIVRNAAGLSASFTVYPPVIGSASGTGNAMAKGSAIKSAAGHSVGTSTAATRIGGKPIGILLTITKV